MEAQERAEYQRFGEVLSDRASQALSIRIQIETAIEKANKEREKADEERKKVNKEKLIIQEKAIVAMIRNTNLSNEKIAVALEIDVKRVAEIRDKMN